jgi:hypothetical protein
MDAISTEIPVAALEHNAFLALSLPADATSKEIYRQQRRIENALELGEEAPSSGFHFIPREPLSHEAVGDAIHRLERQRNLEELFWVHELNGKLSLETSSVDSIIAALRASAFPNTTKGVVAQHNLAVIQICLAQRAEGTRQLEYWRDGIGNWNAILSSDLFWQFLEDRDELSRESGECFPAPDLRAIARETLQKAIKARLYEAIRIRDFSAISFLRDALLFGGKALDPKQLLESIQTEPSAQLIRSIQRALDEVNTLNKETSKESALATLTSAEKEINNIDGTFATITEHLGGGDNHDSFHDEVAEALRQLSIKYFNLLDNHSEALRLAEAALSSVRDPHRRTDLIADCNHIRRAAHIARCFALLEAKNFSGAQAELCKALEFSTHEQIDEISEMQAAVRRASVFGEVDDKHTSPSLSTINGIGTTFYGSRDADPATQSYITTHWFVVLMLPILPLACYRVKRTGDKSYIIYGRVPLSTGLRKYRWAVLAVIGIIILAIIINTNSGGTSSSSTYSPTYTPPQTETSAPSSPIPASGASSSEKEQIEEERTSLHGLADSIDEQRRNLDKDLTELDRLKSQLASIKGTYSDGTAPEFIRQQYNDTVDEYETKKRAYNSAVESYNSGLNEYKGRLAAFNQRVDRYNANQ